MEPPGHFERGECPHRTWFQRKQKTADVYNPRSLVEGSEPTVPWNNSRRETGRIQFSLLSGLVRVEQLVLEQALPIHFTRRGSGQCIEEEKARRDHIAGKLRIAVLENRLLGG